MKTPIHKLIAAALFVTMLLQLSATQAFAQQAVELPSETAAPTETAEQTEPVAQELSESEEAFTFHHVSQDAEIYQLCHELAQQMGARQIFVLDTNTDRILYSKTVETEKLYPASITKLFSAYVALQYLQPNEIITAGEELELVHEGSSVAYVGKGHRLRVKMLVEAMLLPSGNDAAMVLAAAAGRVIGQDDTLTPEAAVQTFVDEMNRQADALGFVKTHFVNPDGWHSGAHYTCLEDMARIAKLALENDTIGYCMSLHEADATFLSGQFVHWDNTNLLLDPEGGYYRSDAIGMKTGFTRPAGYSLMSAFTFGEGQIVVGLFGYTQKNDRFLDAIRLAVAAKEQLRREESAAG